jgi:hypothetical protein
MTDPTDHLTPEDARRLLVQILRETKYSRPGDQADAILAIPALTAALAEHEGCVPKAEHERLLREWSARYHHAVREAAGHAERLREHGIDPMAGLA